jgi:hypothetical protein
MYLDRLSDETKVALANFLESFRRDIRSRRVASPKRSTNSAMVPCSHESWFVRLEVCPKCSEVLSDVPAVVRARHQ